MDPMRLATGLHNDDVPLQTNAERRTVPLKEINWLQVMAGTTVFAGLGAAAGHTLIAKVDPGAPPGPGRMIASVVCGVFAGVVALYSALKAPDQEPPASTVESGEAHGTVIPPASSRQL